MTRRCAVTGHASPVTRTVGWDKRVVSAREGGGHPNTYVKVLGFASVTPTYDAYEPE